MTTPRALTGSLLQTVAASAILLSALTSAASAGVDVSINGNGFSGTPIKVISEDGKSWTKINDGTIKLPLTVGAGMTNHTVLNYIVRQTGQKSGHYLVHDLSLIHI